MHYHARAKFVLEWGSAFASLAEEQDLPKGLDVVAFEALPITGTRAFQDAGNCLPSVKAAVDGLVGYGLLEDDGVDWVKWITLHATVYEKGVNALWLRIIEL